MNSFDWSELTDQCTNFASRLIRTPSMTGEEAAIAELIANEMQKFNFDDVWLDEKGNVFGKIRGENDTLGSIVLNTHLDHVDPGDVSLWSVPPYSGLIRGDNIIGRGACDIKGPLAVQIYSMAALRGLGIRPRRNVVFCGVVEEEMGGGGAVHWAEHLDYDVDLIILGEPSSNQLSLGHRGIAQLWVTFHGKSTHASAPKRNQNPNYMVAEFILNLDAAVQKLAPHPILGETTVAPTIIEVDTKSMNVTPAWTRILLDFRTAVESPNSLRRLVEQVALPNPFKITDALAEIQNQPLIDSDEPIYGFYTPPDDPAVQKVRDILNRGMGERLKLSNYQFATDGRHFVTIGAPIIGFAAGNEKYAHTVDERISIREMAQSLKGHVALLSEF